LLSYSEASVILSSNKDIWVGTDNGVFFFDPLKFKPDGFVPGIYFTDIKVQGKSISGFDSNKKLILQPNQRNLTIQYAALDFKDSKNIKYSYILEGLDDSWHFEGGNRSASYLNLPDGEYLFKVRSTNSDGVWTDNVTTLLIEVKPKFSETVWIWVVYVLIFIILTGIVVYVILTIFRLRHEVDVEQQMSDIKLRFFTDISHDLRTPLTLISCPVADVLENEPISDKVRDQLTVVQNNTNRLLALVNQILDFRKIQNKKMKLVVEEVEILQVVSKIMNDFSQIAEYKDIDFSVNCPDKGVRLWIDKDKFERILFNLLSNAFKYTENGKSVNISITDFDSVIRIIVKDEGPGIAKDQLETIFERFEMGKGNSQQINSSGLGLSLVKELVNLHHAEIFVDSNMGEGSSFILEFKKGRRHFEEDEQAEVLASDGMSSDFLEAEDEEDSLEKLEKRDVIPLVLVVEDNPEMLLFLKEILSRSYTVMTALNGLEGLKVAAEVLPDLIVTDIMMPHMDGLEMIRKIKDNKNICHIPIIVLSAKASIEDKLQGLEAGIDDYITKPFSSSYLLTRIKYLLNQRRVWQEALLSSSTAFSTQYGETARTTKAELMPSEPQVTSYDDIFIKELMKTLEAQLENSSLNVDMLAADLNMSRTVFYKKVKSLLGITPVDLIRDIRIKRAVQLIEVGGFSLTEVAYMCGFSDSNYFSKCFKKATGVTPSKYKESISPN
jgi:signal transduction histidine kinase/DNA-binding response OmpR family regulator